MGDGALEFVTVERRHCDRVIAHQLTEPRHRQRSVVEVGAQRHQHACAASFVACQVLERGCEARARLGVGVGEQLLELVHDQHELGSRVVGQHPANGPGQAAVVGHHLVHKRRDRRGREAQERVLGLVEGVCSGNHRRHPRAVGPQRRHKASADQ